MALRWIRSRWACRRTSRRRSPKARLSYGWVRRFLDKGKTESVMKITFIGGGNMADALIGGLLRKDFPLQDIRVVEISAEARRKLVDKYGVTSFDKPKDAMRANDVVVFAVKPQHLREAAAKSGIADNANLVISIAAGVRLANLSKWLKGHTRLVRAMPNTPAMIGEGVTGLFPFSKAVTREDREQTETVLGAVGATVWITDESQMDAVTAISGSGPAYVFYFIEAVEDAARELGLPVQIAHQLVLNTFTGAAKLASTSPDPVAVLRAREHSERLGSRGADARAALLAARSLLCRSPGHRGGDVVHARRDGAGARFSLPADRRSDRASHHQLGQPLRPACTRVRRVDPPLLRDLSALRSNHRQRGPLAALRAARRADSADALGEPGGAPGAGAVLNLSEDQASYTTCPLTRV